MSESMIYQIAIWLVPLVIAIVFHEVAHGLVARRLGDPTAAERGRLSLNPIRHVDPVGTIILPLILAVSNAGAIFGWAKPVPVNILNLRANWKQKYMLIAAAGPASNLVLATVAALILGMVPGSADPFTSNAVREFLVAMVQLNVLLAVFNMVPLPPLDGGNVLAGVLRGGVADMYERLRPYGFLILYGLLFSGILWRVIGPPYNAILSTLRPLTTVFG
jgi:Zn-dependent protease